MILLIGLPQRLVTIEPDYSGAWVTLGVAQGRGQQWEAVIQSFREVVTRHPQDPFARKNIGVALSQTGHLDEALDQLKGAVVLTCCGLAIRMFEAMPKDEVQKIALEIAMLGAKGFSVNEPSKKYQLRSVSGDFSGLHLLCLEYAGFKIIDPTVDIGFDISAGYAEVCRVLRKSSSVKRRPPI